MPNRDCSGGQASRAAGVGLVRVVAGPTEAVKRHGVSRRWHPERRCSAGLSTPSRSVLTSKTNSNAVARSARPCSGCHGEGAMAFENPILRCLPQQRLAHQRLRFRIALQRLQQPPAVIAGMQAQVARHGGVAKTARQRASAPGMSPRRSCRWRRFKSAGAKPGWCDRACWYALSASPLRPRAYSSVPQLKQATWRSGEAVQAIQVS